MGGNERKSGGGAENEETHVTNPHLNNTDHETGNMDKVEEEGEKDRNGNEYSEKRKE